MACSYKRGYNVMNWDQIEGKWKQMKGKARQKWAKLTDDDLEFIAGNREQFSGRLRDLGGQRSARRKYRAQILPCAAPIQMPGDLAVGEDKR